jgi:dTDP-glucose pyrophosphorylase
MILSLENYIINPNKPMIDAITQIDLNGAGFLCVVSMDKKLLGTITDGNVRRAIIRGLNTSSHCEEIMDKNPVFAFKGISKEAILDILLRYKIRSLPILDANKTLVEIKHLNQLVSEPKVDKIAVIMAGGEGLRLRPLTEFIPKPMIEIDDKPVLEHLIIGLKNEGFDTFYISVNYLSDKITSYFRNGENLGVKIKYLHEKNKLGTAGALSMLPKDIPEIVLVLNGDILSKVSYQSIIDFHISNESHLTVAASTYKFEIPFGVMNISENFIVENIQEKPVKTFLCNAGIYILSPETIKLIPKDERFDMTDLIDLALLKKNKVQAFPLYEQWIDIGTKDDLIRAKDQ